MWTKAETSQEPSVEMQIQLLGKHIVFQEARMAGKLLLKRFGIKDVKIQNDFKHIFLYSHVFRFLNG